MPRATPLTLLALAAAALLAGSGQATSVAAARPHDPTLACSAVKELVEDLNAGQPLGRQHQRNTFYYTDALGMVGPAEQPAFIKALRENDGKADEKPMRLTALWLLESNGARALYAVRLRRTAWQLHDYEQDGLLGWQEVDRPHWAESDSYWLIEFWQNTISRMREADELRGVTGKLSQMPGCPDWP